MRVECSDTATEQHQCSGNGVSSISLTAQTRCSSLEQQRNATVGPTHGMNSAAQPQQTGTARLVRRALRTLQGRFRGPERGRPAPSSAWGLSCPPSSRQPMVRPDIARCPDCGAPSKFGAAGEPASKFGSKKEPCALRLRERLAGCSEHTHCPLAAQLLGPFGSSALSIGPRGPGLGLEGAWPGPARPRRSGQLDSCQAGSRLGLKRARAQVCTQGREETDNPAPDATRACPAHACRQLTAALAGPDARPLPAR